jgi:hypothetical protein
MYRWILGFVCIVHTLQAVAITPEQAELAGQKIWKNECKGTVQGLTSWNKVEEFPSLGIGHFIWFPEGVTLPFKETFPDLIVYLNNQNVKIPNWLKNAKVCPWTSREAFLQDINSPRMVELRELLNKTISLQAIYMARRFEKAIPAILQKAPESIRESLQRKIDRIEQTPLGFYVLIDYINFKGEGISEKETYNGLGWGLLQVLQDMPDRDKGNMLKDFVESAQRVLTRRVVNAPADREESRWLKGWYQRLETYLE